MHDLIIIGGGPAGAAASVYAARKQLHTLHLTDTWGGQSVESTDIQNWIGTPSITGTQLAKELEQHVRTYAGDCVTIHDGVRVNSVQKPDDATVTVTTDDNHVYSARALLVATGSHRRTLNIPGAKEFEHKGVTYCASCDGPMFTGQPVVVIGGGNAGFESAAQLRAYTTHVTILQRSARYKADPVTVERVLEHDNVTGITNASPTRINGEQFVTGVAYEDNDGTEHSIDANGVFVEIGLIPNTSFVKDLVETDSLGRITIDPWNQKSSVPGIWAAGDCTNILYHQNNISAGDAVTALEDVYVTLNTK
jgi:alkyl hydroperoxide reductase subunit F